ncbi:MAG: hypothetical protein WD208_06720 [Dehalococcoidia bacterium]
MIQRIILITEHPVPGLPVHLTGLDGAYCPELDDRTGAAIEVVLNVLPIKADPHPYFVGVDEIAQATYGSNDRQARRSVSERFK